MTIAAEIFENISDQLILPVASPLRQIAVYFKHYDLF